jgi:CRISPR/Cas system-associated exonuclease Cas4 (RecB family)
MLLFCFLMFYKPNLAFVALKFWVISAAVTAELYTWKFAIPPFRPRMSAKVYAYKNLPL